MKRDRLLLASALAQFALLVPLIGWARRHKQSLREALITRFMQKRQTSSKRAVVKVLNTLTGSAVFMNILVIPAFALLWKMRLRSEARATIASCYSGALVRTLLKRLVNRPRPNAMLMRTGKQSAGKSFPSGHVASSVCLWGWLCALGLLSQKIDKKLKGALLSITTAFVLFTGPARVYLGDHWATDVLGGYLFGGGWLSLSLGLYLRWRKQ